MAVTAIVNQKGGVGKTTVTLGLAAAMSAAELRVLVVDLDPQANATTGLGVFDAAATIEAALAEEVAGALGDVIVRSPWSVAEGAHPVDLVPSSPRLAQREHQLALDVIGAQERVALALRGVAERYDEVLIDCPPSLGLLTVNALFAADRALIVAEPAAWSSDGVDQIRRNIARITERRGGRPELAGIVVNRLGRTRDAAHWHEQLTEVHPGVLLDPPVRLRAAVTEAAAASVPVHALRRDGAAAAVAEFDALAARLRRGPAPSGAAAERPDPDPAVPGAAGGPGPGQRSGGSPAVGPDAAPASPDARSAPAASVGAASMPAATGAPAVGGSAVGGSAVGGSAVGSAG